MKDRQRSAVVGVFLACGISLGLAGSACGQVCNMQAHKQECSPLGCKRYTDKGSAVCIGKDSRGRAIYLTSGHALRLSASNGKLLGVHVANGGRWVRANVIGVEDSNVGDVAILSVSGIEPSCVPIMEPGEAAAAQLVTVKGFAGGVDLWCQGRRVLSGNRNWTWFEGSVPEGLSGGAVILDGSIAGIVKGTAKDGSSSVATSASTLRGMLMAFVGEIPQCQGAKPKPNPAPLWNPEGEKPAPRKIEPRPDPISAESSAPDGSISPEVYRRKKPAGSAAPANVPAASDAGESGNPGRVLPGIVGTAAGTAAGSWLTGLVGLAIGGPLGAAVGLAAGALVKRLVTRGTSAVVNRAEGAIEQRVDHARERWFPPAQGAPPPVPPAPPVSQPMGGMDPGGQVAATSDPLATVRTIERQRNHYVDVPIVNSEAEALKEAMRLEAEFTKHEKPDVAAHLKRVQEMADMILSGKKISKPGWKI